MVNTVIDWLRRPSEHRPRFIALYFDAVDTAGHHYGPGDRRTAAAVTRVDRAIGRLLVVAEAYPNLKGIISPTPVVVAAAARYLSTSDKKGKVLYSNVEGLTYAANESGCLVGVLAAKMAQKAGKVWKTPGGQDFKLEVADSGSGDGPAYRLGGFKAFLGQPEHARHERFAARRTTIS